MPSCELARLVAGTKNLVPATSHTNSNEFEFLGQVPATSPFVQTHYGTGCRDYSQGLVSSCVPTLTVCPALVSSQYSLNIVRFEDQEKVVLGTRIPKD